MDVIGHQYVGMDLAVVRTSRVMQLCKIGQIVLITKEAGLPIVPAQDDVLRNTGDMKTGLARHGVVARGGKLYLAPGGGSHAAGLNRAVSSVNDSDPRRLTPGV
jgi:hypothetical protein